MQYKRLGSIIAVVLASAVGWSLNLNFRPVQAETGHPELATGSEDELSSAELSSPELSAEPSTEFSTLPSATDVAKVGEPATAQVQSAQAQSEPGLAIAKVFSHELESRPAATVYVRDIPVLTFLNEVSDSDPSSGEAVMETEAVIETKETAAEGRKLATQDEAASPLFQANSLAAKLNRLSLSGDLDARKIAVRWEDEKYLVQLEDETLVTLTENVILPDTTGARTEDALQATNRLRRLLGEAAAEPLTEVADLPAPPEPEPVVASAPRSDYYQQGWASWYGPGFNGNRTANGEIFNQNALTAAHRYLAFGTWVRVTNVNTGYAVNVRINDRGPYAGDRVIDLSAAAADSIGLTHSGVAQVRIDILN